MIDHGVSIEHNLNFWESPSLHLLSDFLRTFVLRGFEVLATLEGIVFLDPLGFDDWLLFDGFEMRFCTNFWALLDLLVVTEDSIVLDGVSFCVSANSFCMLPNWVLMSLRHLLSSGKSDWTWRMPLLEIIIAANCSNEKDSNGFVAELPWSWYRVWIPIISVYLMAFLNSRCLKLVCKYCLIKLCFSSQSIAQWSRVTTEEKWQI